MSVLPDRRMAIELEAGGFTLPHVVLFPKTLLPLCLEQSLEGVEVNLPQPRQHLQTLTDKCRVIRSTELLRTPLSISGLYQGASTSSSVLLRVPEGPKELPEQCPADQPR